VRPLSTPLPLRGMQGLWLVPDGAARSISRRTQ
jgi:hypothetical protein